MEKKYGALVCDLILSCINLYSENKVFWNAEKCFESKEERKERGLNIAAIINISPRLPVPNIHH